MRISDWSSDVCSSDLSTSAVPVASRMIVDPLFYLAAVPAVLIAGISKGGFGAGLGLLAVPMMALVLPPVQVAAIMLPILCLMDLVGIWAYWQKWEGSVLLRLALAAAVGVAAARKSVV